MDESKLNVNETDPSGPVKITLTYDMEGKERLLTPRSYDLTVTAILSHVFNLAFLINENIPPPLSFSSLLMAMIMEGGDTSGWLYGYLQGRGVTVEKIASHSSRTVDQKDIKSRGHTVRSQPLGMTISARRAVEQAHEVANTLSRNSPLDIRHLAAAYPVLREWHEKDFEELGIDRLEWCRSFGAFMAVNFPNEKRYWREYADRASPVPLTSFSADVYTEKDLLGIERTVEALALLISSTRTDTPLSIGVFGQWGSGKSFFMQHLRRRIWNLAERERDRVNSWVEKRKAKRATSHDAPLYFDQIAQVQFNAWHYSDGNIVASLVDHLFRNLQVLPDPSDRELEHRRAAILLKITGAKHDIANAEQIVEQTKSRIEEAKEDVTQKSKQVEQARNNVDSLASELEARTQQASQARGDLESEIRQLGQTSTPDANAAIAVAVQPLLESPVVKQAWGLAEDFASQIKDWRQFLSRALTLRGAVVVTLCLSVPLVGWFTEWLSHQWAAAVGVISTSAATIWQFFGLVRERRKQFEAKMNELQSEEARGLQERRSSLQQYLNSLNEHWKVKIGQLQDSLEQRRNTLAERETELSTAVRSLAERTKEFDLRVQERQAADKKLTQANADLDQLSSTRLLDEFLKSRVSTDEYQKRLGFLALVRRDFERLSDLIAKANTEWCDPSTNTDPPPLNRIVLYIDDLDRCSEETVLKVLEVVHLLLAFRLFVCVVAVDPRWIEECLRQKHKYLFAEQEDGGVRVTAGDYLEKIFQIPIWTSPLDADQRASVVNALLGKSASPQPLSGGPHPGVTQLDSPLPPDLAVARQTTDAFQVLVNKAEGKLDPLRVTDDETDFVEEIKSLLSDKPRALKRFVNTYRLLKASLADIDRENFVRTGAASPHRICICQLALFTSHPRSAPLLVRQLRKPGGANTNLDVWFSSLDEKTHATLEPTLSLVPDRAQIPLTEFQAWLPETSKYLFHRDD